MKYLRFGRTELQMPVLSCGGMRYQHKWQDADPEEIPPANLANLEAIIHCAIELVECHPSHRHERPAKILARARQDL